MTIAHISDAVELIKSMKSNTLHNYVLPGLSSSLLSKGKVRLFESCRNTTEAVTPHSHRFNFSCLVLEGSVVNTIWEETRNEKDGDLYLLSELAYRGEPGKYEKTEVGSVYCVTHSQVYEAGQWYNMEAIQIHSIRFSRGASVLFFEGEEIINTTEILEPIVNDRVVPTFKVEDWMFTKGEVND